MRFRPGRLLRVGACPLVLVAVLVGCSSADDPTETARSVLVTSPSVPSTSLPSAGPAAASTTTPPATTAEVVALPVPDGPALLQQGFAELAAGYHFLTVATVQGAVAVAAEGDHLGDRTQLSVTSNGATLLYVIAPEGSWVFDNGVWQELDELAPVTDPISPLTAPIDVTVTAYGEASAMLAATYPAAALALPGEGMVTVLFEMMDTSIRSMTYTSPVDTQTSVRADISMLTDQTVISVPSLDG